MLSTCVKLLQWLRYFGFYSTQARHTYSVSQPLSSSVSWSWNRHRNIAEIDVYRHRLEISLLLCCQHVSNCFNDWGILDSTPHRHRTHILSPNHCHDMYLCPRKGTKTSLQLTFVDTDSGFQKSLKTPRHFDVTQCHVLQHKTCCDDSQGCVLNDNHEPKKATLHTLSIHMEHMTHFLLCACMDPYQSRFLLLGRWSRVSLCVCTKASHWLSCLTNRTSRSSTVSYKAE